MANNAPPFPLRRILWLALCALPATPWAAEQPDGRWALCPPPVGIPTAPAGSDEPEQPIHLFADEMEAHADASSRFSGNVVVTRGTAELKADAASYDQPSDTLVLEGNVSFLTPRHYFQGESARVQLATNSGELQATRFHFSDIHAFGEARRIDIQDSQHTVLEGVVYSTCNPEKQDWRLKASTLELDRESNTGEAYNVTLAFKGVPFLYLPYLNFPLEGRKSGFLAPSFGRTEVAGNDIRLPFYWNIAPEYDATITARSIAARGNMLMAEGRYLAPDESRGTLNVEWLPEDRLYEDRRLYTAFNHRSPSRSGWGLELTHSSVSDPYYFNDMTTSQLAASQTHLERRADVSYRASHWSLVARAQNYQTLVGDEPYSRMPQLLFNTETPRRPDRPYLNMESELVYFTHADQAVIQGSRLDLTPGISLPLQGASWFLTPRLALRHTEYNLKNSGDNEERHSRTLPVTSLDWGLFFERDSSMGETAMVQSFEPRLYYLYVPYSDQDALPLFDSGFYDFSFSQLFRENRFSGADRVGDANQLTNSLTSRYLEEASGREWGRVSFGQITYFEDRKVNLTPATADSRSSSDIVAEVAVKPLEDLEFSSAGRWNPKREVEDLLTSSLRFRPAEDKVASLTYRYQRELDLRQTDLTVFWPMTRQWRVIGRWQYDLENELSYDTVGGLEYQSCCWAFRLIGRGRYNTSTEEIDHSIYLTLELKGLTSIGNRLDAELERGILGFPIH
ncbi:MAG TPA: LPS assembly protein LptD [Gammaproteobacteria bacterium]